MARPGRSGDRSRLPRSGRRLPGRGSGVAGRRPSPGRPSAACRGTAPDRRPRAGRRAAGRGRGQPGLPRLPAVAHGLLGHRARPPDLPPGHRGPGRPRPGRLRPRAGRRGTRGHDAGAPAGRSTPATAAPHAGAGVRRARPGRRLRDGRHGPRDPRPRPGAPVPERRAPHRRRRPRPHRHGLAVAAAGDRPQVHPHLRLCSAAHGRLPGLPVRVLAGRSVRVDAGAASGAVRRYPGEGRRRAVDPRGWHVGGDGRQHPERGVHRPPARPRSTFLRGALRPPLPRGLDPRRVRLPGLTPADLRRRRVRPLRDAEAVVEQGEPVPSQHLLVGGHRRQPGAHALPSGGDVQRHDRRRRSRPTSCATSTSTAGATGR